MGKQKKCLSNIIWSFQKLLNDEKLFVDKNFRETHKFLIRRNYKNSLNKKDLVYRILFDAVLSDDEIINLLRIIFDKEK